VGQANRAITLRGQGIDVTTIDCGAQGRAVGIVDSTKGRDTVVEELTLQNGRFTDGTTDGGCVYVSNGASPTFRKISVSGCTVSGSYSTYGGGVIVIGPGTAPLFQEVLISSNSVEYVLGAKSNVCTCTN